MAINSKKLGARIKQYRTEKNLSQDDLAETIGTVYKHISNIELGYKVPGIELIVLLADALDVSADDLLQDSLKHSSTQENKAINDLLKDCSPDEKEMLTRTLKFLKELLTEFGI